MFPLTLTWLTLELTNSRLVAALAPLLGVGLTLPSMAFSGGAQLPSVVAFCLHTKTLRAFLFGSLALFLTYLLAGYLIWPVPLIRLAFPWDVAERLTALQWFYLPLVAAFGVMKLHPWLTTHLASNQASSAATRKSALAITLVVGLTVLTGTHNQLEVWRVGNHSPTTDADLAAFHQLDANLPPNSVVLTDGALDAGDWIDSMTRDHVWSPTWIYRTYAFPIGPPSAT